MTIEDNRRLIGLNTPPLPRPDRLDFAQAGRGIPLPIVYGTVRVDTPVLLWNGNGNAVSDGSGGFTYSLDMLLGLGVPSWDEAAPPYNNWRVTYPPKLGRFWYGDKIGDLDTTVQNVPSATGLGIVHGGAGIINVSGIDGGSEHFRQQVQFFDGRPTQSLVDGPIHLIRSAMVFAGMDLTKIPGYRHQMLAGITSIDGFGASTHVAKISFETQSLGPQPVTTASYGVPLDANPAWIIYDLLFGKVWKLGLDPTRADLTSFQTAASTCIAEGWGASLALYRSSKTKAVIESLERMVNGKIVEDQSTGLISLRFRRANYTPGLLQEMSEDNTVERPKLTYVGGEDLSNQAVVHFTNRNIDYKDDTAPDHRLGNAIGQSNRLKSVDLDYPMVCDPVVAAAIASRDLNVVSRPLISGTAMLNREFYALQREDVLRCNWPKWNCVGKVFRVLEVGDGQLAKGQVKVTLIEDVFAAVSGAGLTPPEPDPLLNLVPLTERLFDEAPFLLCQRSFLEGTTGALDQRMIGAAMAESLGFAANRFHQDTTSTPPGGVAGASTADVPLHALNAVALVDLDYARTADPYDTVTGLRVSIASLGTQAQALFAAMLTGYTFGLSPPRVPDEIRYNFANLILVRPAGASSGGEIMAFEGHVDNGGGSHTFTKVWRGLMDTVAVDHLAGSVVIWISTADLGARAWLANFTATATSYPNRFALDGTGDDAVDAVVVSRRIDLPPPIADFGAGGYEATGTSGIPSSTTSPNALAVLKRVTDLDGALDFAGRSRRLDPDGQIWRGDETDAAAPDADATFSLLSQKLGEGEEEIITDLASFGTATAKLLGPSGHGEIDVICRSSGDGGQSWQDPRVRVTAPRYRNLLGGGSFEYSTLTPWASISGPARSTGTSSLSRKASGAFVAGAGTMNQVVDVAGYKGKGLTALLTYYALGVGIEGNNIRVQLSDGVGDSADSTSFAPGTGWERHTLEMAIASPLEAVEVDLTLTGSAKATGFVLQLGQYTSQLLTNPNFDGGLTGWSALGTIMDADATFPHSSDGGVAGLAVGASAATSGLKQTVAIPAGYEYGSAVLEYWTGWKSTIGTVGDTLTVQVIPLDGGGATLVLPGGIPFVVTTFTAADAECWTKRRVVLDLPDGCASLRVEVTATRAGGSRCGAAIDATSLRVWKHLDPTTEIDFDFGAPVRARTPYDWQTFHLAYPTLAIPVVFGGLLSAASVQPSEAKLLSREGWSDASSDLDHRGSMQGYFKSKQEVASDDLSCYVFNGAAPFIRSGGLLDDNYGKFTAADSFTVAVLMRSTPFSWTTASALVGRRDGTGIGWGLGVDALGRAKATFQGTSSTLSINSSDVVADRAPHWVFLRCDGASMKLYTKAGIASTALVGLGSTDITFQDLCIGLDGSASNVFQGQIARVYIWDSALADADIQAIVAEIGADPSGLLTTWNATKPMWVPGAPNTDGETLVRCGISDIPIGYSAALDATGDGYGLVTGRANLNRVVTNDTTDISHWGPEAGSFTITQGIVDATGLPCGVRVAQNTPSAGYRITDMSGVGTIINWSTVVYMRCTSGTLTVNVELRDSSDVSKGSVACALTTSWKRFAVTHAWDAATPTAHLRFVIAAGGTGTYEICHAIWSGESLAIIGGTGLCAPFAIQDAGQSQTELRGTRDVALPIEMHYDGEIYAEAVQGAGSLYESCIASVYNDADMANKRLLLQDSSNLTAWIYDNAGTRVVGTPNITEAYTAAFSARARWNRQVLPESSPNRIGCVGGGSIDYAAGSSWSVGAAGNTHIGIGHAGFGAPTQDYRPPNAIIRRVVVRSREAKLEGA